MYKKNSLFIMLAMLCITAANISCGYSTGAVSVPLLAPKPAKSAVYHVVDSNNMVVVDVVEGLNFRTCPGMDCPAFGLLQLGDVVRLTGNAETKDAAQWVEVEYLGVTGWVNFRYLGER